MRGAAIAGNPGLIEMIKHHRMFYADLRDPVSLLKGEYGDTALSRYWAYARSGNENLETKDIAAYSALMSKSQTLVADMLLDLYPLDKHRVLLDIGGGDGEFILRAAARHPHLSFKHFDLPAVSKLAVSRFEAAGLKDRAVSAGGSFFEHALPEGADVATLIRIIHDHDEKNAQAIFGAARRALAPGGILLIAEPLAGTAGAEAMSDAYFAFYLMAMGSGRPRTLDEMKSLILGAGFASAQEIRSHLPLQFRLLVART
jgi:demethylspheroidene O-methyltransferase